MSDDEFMPEASGSAASAAAAASVAASVAASASELVVKSDLLMLLAYATLSAALCELIGYFFIYRRPEYERLTSNFVKASKRLEKKREEPAPLPKGGKDKPVKDKKLLQLEREFEIANRDLITLKSRTGMFTALVHACTFFMLKSSYESVVLAKLPFHPFTFLQGITHRNLPGVDPTDCGMIFIYALCSQAIKPNLQKALGHAPPKTAIPAGAQRLAEKWSGIKASDLR